MNNRWFAVTIEVLKSPEKIFHTPEASVDDLNISNDSTTKLIGTVTYIGKNMISVNNSINYTFNNNEFNNFCPIKGDSVVAIVDHSDASNKIINISPLKTIDFEGKITSRRIGGGDINNEIFFRKSINKNLDLKCGLKVFGKAIEFVQRKYKLRAINMYQMNETSVNENQFIENDYHTNLTTKKIENNANENLKFIIPNELELAVESNKNLFKSYPILEQNLTPLNYKSKMRLLLFLEEIAAKEHDYHTNLTTKKIENNANENLKFIIPNELELAVESNKNLFKSYPILEQKLTPLNYKSKMRLLIFLEEIAAKEKLKLFVLENVILLKKSNLVEIVIDDLNENVFRLIIGDKIKIKLNEGDFSIVSGLIVNILSNSIVVKVDMKFYRNYSNEKCTIFFEHNRTNFLRVHLGIDTGTKLINSGITFPEKIEMKSSQLSKLNSNENIIDWKYFNKSLNELQKLAVVRILRGVCRPLPYILFGPPGTGKTITLVEIVLQILRNIPNSRILLCSPTNNVADLLCLKLHDTGVIKNGEMARVISHHRFAVLNVLKIPLKLESYMEIAEECPNLLSKRIIITTINSSALLYPISKNSNHFTHVFIDEASQANEPEVMIPIGLLSLERGQILLTGDPMQLGPVYLSKYSKDLKRSYLERLLYSCKIYQTQRRDNLNDFNPLLVTNLIHNYRSHPALLKLPSDIFYKSKLISCANETKFLNWKWLPNPEFPLIFHKVIGNEGRLSSSVYNIDEAKVIITWIKRLLEGNDNDKKVEPENITVITPYRAQVVCIQNLLNVSYPIYNIDKLKIGSVEEFQGQENDVILISTVRSSVGIETEKQSLKSRLSFLSSGQRFNVSITRAKSLLIVVGDPELLIHDKFWCDLIKYAELNGASI